MLKSRIAGSHSSSILSFLRIHYLFFVMIIPFYILNKKKNQGSLFSTPSPAYIVCRLFNDDHSFGCEVIPHYSLGISGFCYH